MMISPAGGDPYAAAAALDRQLRSPASDASDPSDSDASPDAGPDVVVTLSQGSSSPATYGPTGKFSGRPSLEDMGANAPDSLVHATEASGDDDDSSAGATSGATSASSASPDADDGSADASVDEDAAVAA